MLRKRRRHAAAARRAAPVTRGGLFAALLVLIAAPAAADTVTFSVAAGALGLQTGAFARGKEPDEIVRLSLPGALYDPPLPVQPVAGPRATPEAALAADYAANLAGDANAIVAGFAPQDRDDIRALVEDPDMLARNTATSRDLERMAITGQVLLGDHALLLISHWYDGVPWPAVYAFVETPEGYLRANALSNDPAFDVVFTALRGGEVTAGGQ